VLREQVSFSSRPFPRLKLTLSIFSCQGGCNHLKLAKGSCARIASTTSTRSFCNEPLIDCALYDDEKCEGKIVQTRSWWT
jgi:hypothetical protein